MEGGSAKRPRNGTNETHLRYPSPLPFGEAGWGFYSRLLNAKPKMTYWVLPAMVPSFSPQRKGQSS